MEQPIGDRESRPTRNRRRRTRQRRSDTSSQPWGLVIFIALLLAGFLFYIKWVNSPEAEEYHSFWAYLAGPAPGDVRSDSLAIPADDRAVLFGTDAAFDGSLGADDDWSEADSPVALPSSEDVFSDNPNPAAATSVAAPITRPDAAAAPTSQGQVAVYVINAGEFKTKGSAQFRVSELRQGNYAARLIEPASPDGMYKVVVGEYQKESTARSVAQSMSFILEIRASVEEKR